MEGCGGFVREGVQSSSQHASEHLQPACSTLKQQPDSATSGTSPITSDNQALQGAKKVENSYSELRLTQPALYSQYGEPPPRQRPEHLKKTHGVTVQLCRSSSYRFGLQQVHSSFVQSMQLDPWAATYRWGFMWCVISHSTEEV